MVQGLILAAFLGAFGLVHAAGPALVPVQQRAPQTAAQPPALRGAVLYSLVDNYGFRKLPSSCSAVEAERLRFPVIAPEVFVPLLIHPCNDTQFVEGYYRGIRLFVPSENVVDIFGNHFSKSGALSHMRDLSSQQRRARAGEAAELSKRLYSDALEGFRQQLADTKLGIGVGVMVEPYVDGLDLLVTGEAGVQGYMVLSSPVAEIPLKAIRLELRGIVTDLAREAAQKNSGRKMLRARVVEIPVRPLTRDRVETLFVDELWPLEEDEVLTEVEVLRVELISQRGPARRLPPQEWTQYSDVFTFPLLPLP